MPAGSRVDYLRRKRVSASTVLRSVIREFAGAPGTIFCFVEGKDGAYYDVRIRHELEQSRLRYLNCNGKDTLLEVYVSIKKNDYRSNSIGIFFFDRDYEWRIDGLDRTICYITDGYSVENFYTSREAFSRIIRSAFFSDQIYEEDDHRCIASILCCFDRLQRQFHEALLLFNSWAFVQRHREHSGRFNLSVIDDRRLSTVDLDGVQATYSLEELNRQFPEREEVTESDIVEAAKWFAEREARLAFRGKQEAQFVLDLCNVLSEKASLSVPPFHRKLTCRLRLSVREFISDLSLFADTPDSLRMFLREVRDKTAER